MVKAILWNNLPILQNQKTDLQTYLEALNFYLRIILLKRVPLITIGLVALNRAWIIDKSLSSLLSQTYPHDRLHVLFVDGDSKDETAEIAEKILSKSDFKGYEIIVKKCTIPEGRNICLERMQGDLLLFWDSDVIMQSDAISGLAEALETENADLMSADVKHITISSISEIPERLKKISSSTQELPRIEVKTATMSQSLLSKKLTSSVAFDPDLTSLEDNDFCLRARTKGFKIMLDRNIVGIDVNMYNVSFSDIHIDTPLRVALRGIRKKSKAQVYTYDFPLGWKSVFNFYLQHKRYLFYFVYIPTAVLTLIGILFQNIFLAVIFPAYVLVYFGLQIRRRGIAKGFKALIRSLIIGVPNAFWITYYCLEAITKPQNRSYS